MSTTENLKVLSHEEKSKQQVEAIAKLMEEAAENDKDLQLINSLPSNNGVEEVPEENIGEAITEKAMVTVNPNTGLADAKPVSENDEEEEINKSLANMLDISVEELLEVPKTAEELQINEDILGKSLTDMGVDEASVVDMVKVIDTFRKTPNEDVDKIKWYPQLPISVQKLICESIGDVAGPQLKLARELFATEFLKEAVRSAGIDTLVVDLDNILKNETDKLKDFVIDNLNSEFETTLQKRIDIIKDSKLDDAQKAKIIGQFEEIQSAFRASYELTDFNEALKRIKIRPFDVKKYKRFCADFRIKYQRGTSMGIKDVEECIPVLMRKYPDLAEYVPAYIVGFCKYCLNFKPDNIGQHTFMYYFVFNITNLDLINGLNDGEYKNNDKLIENVRKGIQIVAGIEE